MAFRFTCCICHRTAWNSDNRNAQRKHLTCGELCRKLNRAQLQKIRRAKARQQRLESTAHQETINIWHPRRNRLASNRSRLSTSKPNPKASGRGRRMISKERVSASKKRWTALKRRSRK